MREIVSTLVKSCPDGDASVIDIGSFNGYISLLARLADFEVTGSDGFVFADRDVIFGKYGIHFLRANLNDIGVFSDVAGTSFDTVIFAEIFEHILNHPVGVLQQIGRILKPGGLLVLTTPNPSTIGVACGTWEWARPRARNFPSGC